MNKRDAIAQAEAHEACALRNPNPAKREQHLLAARLLREQFGIVSFGGNPRCREVQQAEIDRITQWKESR